MTMPRIALRTSSRGDKGPGDGADRPPPAGDDVIAVASQRQLIWWRFKKHRLAVIGAGVIMAFYLVALGGDFFATADPNASDGEHIFVPPQGVGTQAYPLEGVRDPSTFEMTYVQGEGEPSPVKLFAHGYEYKFLGVFSTDIHLFGVEGGEDANQLYVLGTDQEGRDIYSRLVMATRTSLLVGLAGVGLSLFLGVALGGISGYYGGWVDSVIQRLIEITQSIPTIPLWLGLAAAIPKTWGVVQTYFVITIIISLVGWTELARVVRGRFLQVRHEDFITAAELVGARPRRLIFVHMMPLFTSHIIAATTLALPLMIVAETALSFLGLGLRPPAVSWGVMLQEAQNIQAIALSPWMLIPVIPVVVAILAFNFVGDGLRDAADPYQS
jgi:peptide/nickel transport system permease protein